MIELALDPTRGGEAERAFALATAQLCALGGEELPAQPPVALGADAVTVAARLEAADPALVELPERSDEVRGQRLLAVELVEPPQGGLGDRASRLELRPAQLDRPEAEPLQQPGERDAEHDEGGEDGREREEEDHVAVRDRGGDRQRSGERERAAHPAPAEHGTVAPR